MSKREREEELFEEVDREPEYLFDERPSWVPPPLDLWLWTIRYDEIRASALGTVGFLAGYGYAVGLEEETTTFTVLAVAVAFGLRTLPEEELIGGRVISQEPWYFITMFIVTAIIGARMVAAV